MQPVTSDTRKYTGHFDALFQNATLCIFFTDMQGRITASNPFALQSFGYTADELFLQPVEILIPERYHLRHRNYHENYFNDPQTKVMGAERELYAVRKNGTEFPVQISLAHYKHKGASFVTVFLSDISAQKKLEDQLIAEESSVQLLIEHTPAAIAMLDRNMNYILVSKRWMKDYHLEGRNITGMNHYTVFPDLPEEWKQLHRECLEGKSFSRDEDSFVRETGEVEWLRWEICPWYETDHNKIGGIIIFSELITQQRKNNISLQVSEARLVKEARDLVMLNEAGNRLWRIKEFDAGLKEILDVSTRLFETDAGTVQLLDKETNLLRVVSGTGLSEAFIDQLNERSAEGFRACDKAFTERKQIATMDVKKDQSFAPCLPLYLTENIRAVLSTPLFNTDGSPIGIINCYFREPCRFNPVELKKMELYALNAEGFIISFYAHYELQKTNEELEEKVEQRTRELSNRLINEKKLNELKSRFVSMASHEFRTPLSTILSSAYLLEKYTRTEEQSKREKHLQRITSSVQMMTGILNDFLSVGKIEEGKIYVRYTPFSLDRFMKDNIDEISTSLKPGQCITYRHDGEVNVMLDPALLKHIFMNLVSNACKFSGENKVIAISTRCNGLTVQLKVKDQGIGISANDQQHLAERFFRGENAANIDGTGLGLYIVTRYAELMNGNVECHSELEKGTEFTITLTSKQSDYEKDIID